jgi:Fe-S cluster biogenesis protein NfuA/nitrite reductase/ring-hydroxylating ferredoxin subunit
VIDGADEEGDAEIDFRATGERIAALLDASAGNGPVASARTEELVRLVVDLYGAALERMLDALFDVGRLDQVALDALVADELVSSLLLVHGLHPLGVTERVERALESVRPYLASHGGDVELLEVTEDGSVRLRLLGSCDGCASSAATLTLAIEDAIHDAAPEVVAIEVDTRETRPERGERLNETLIPVDSLRVRRATSASGDPSSWERVPSVDDIEPGEVRATSAGDVAIVVCRVGGDLFAFRDQCPACAGDLGAAALERRLGGGLGDAVLRCRHCGSHYEVRRAGASLERGDEHLDPLPLLTRRGGVEVALPRRART